jgi:hypothetical protein
MNLLQLVAVAVTFTSSISGAIASPSTMQFDVEANDHVWNGGSDLNSDVGLSTGVFFNLGDSFSINVDNIADSWRICPSTTDCATDADGNRIASGNAYGTYTNSGYTFNFGALVGRIAGGDIFSIGTSGFNGLADVTGELSLYHWDYNTNNSGSIAVTVTYASYLYDVSGPSTIGLLSLTLVGLGLGFARRRKLQS